VPLEWARGKVFSGAAEIAAGTSVGYALGTSVGCASGSSAVCAAGSAACSAEAKLLQKMESQSLPENRHFAEQKNLQYHLQIGTDVEGGSMGQEGYPQHLQSHQHQYQQMIPLIDYGWRHSQHQMLHLTG
jgi:hypothetical protein